MIRDPLALTPVKTLLADVAAGGPTPGGIGLAAVTASQAAALVSLVARQTAGKPGYEPMTEEMERLQERARALAEQVLVFLDQEVEAFNQLLESVALPKGATEHDEQSTIRRDLMRNAARSYVQVPFQIHQIAMELVPMAESVARYGNRQLVADGGTALMLAIAAVRSAGLQVLLNLQGQEEDEWGASTREKVERSFTEVDGLEGDLWPQLLTRVRGGEG
ncbi:MAG: cyclodeaminase/cyclohydrolase family protein [Candidatus Sericytochromatia bacterium]|nr:cyclodeaminase/cyclohydrolase family protein [Candidatus Sericytochromatia bacterium]